VGAPKLSGEVTMLKKTRSLIGLDVGSSCVKAVELSQVGSEVVVTAYGQTDVLSEGSRADAILDLLHSQPFRTRRVVTAVSGKSVIVRYLTMVQMSDEDLRNAIKFEADKYIPFDVDEVVLDCQKLEDARDGDGSNMRVLLVAVKRSLIEDHVALLQGIGLQPAVIDVDSFALGNAFEQHGVLSPGFEEDGAVSALIDIGANKTNINILRGGTTYFTREIYLGGDDFTSAIAKRLGVELHQAEVLKREPGDNGEELREAVIPSIEDLGNEIHLSFDYFENQFDQEVEDVYLSGGGSRLHILEDAFEKIFEKRTRTWDPTENLKIRADSVDVEALKDNCSQLAVAVGLASRIRKD
jgi:type IV pilus assembly protein PilM